MTEVLWVLVLVLAVVAVAGAAAVTRIRFNQLRDNQVVPGVATSAPVAWAGAHTEEARLHRRIRDAVRALRSAAGGADTPSALRDSLEREALTLDERLVAVAALPQRVRAEPLAMVASAVAALEDAAAAWANSMATGSQVQPGAVDAVTERLRLVGEAREELERGYPDIPFPDQTWQAATPVTGTGPPAQPDAGTDPQAGHPQPGQSS